MEQTTVAVNTAKVAGRPRRRGFWPVLLLLSLPVALFAALHLLNPQAGETALAPGRPAPDFALAAQNGATHRLADYRGRAVFLAFVPDLTSAATRAEVRSLKATASSFDEAGAKVFLVSPDDAQKARALHETEKLPFPVLSDTGNALAKRFGVSGRRATYVVEPSGALKFYLPRVNVAEHGRQLLDLSNCCLDERVAAMAAGVGKKVGDFSLPRADRPGAPMTTIYGDKTQKATVVVFTSARCPCANDYSDRLRDMAQAFGSRGVRFVSVYANQDETLADISAHAKTSRLPFVALKDDRAQAADHFKAHVTPEAFVLDRTGVLRYHGRIDSSRDAAQATSHELRDTLAALTDGKGGSVPAETHAFGCAILRQAPGDAKTASGG